MNHSIAPGLIPPERGLEKEEPDLWQEEDIPTDDGATPSPQGSKEERPVREVERE